MKGSCSTALRTASPSLQHPTKRCCVRAVSTNVDSTPRSRPPMDSAEDVFRRNLREVQTFRRRRDALKMKTPFIPADAFTPVPKPSPLSTLLATGAALGCSSSKLHPQFAQYVYANRSGLSIIDLDQTLPIIRRTAALVRDIVKEDGVVLFVGTRPGMQKSLEKAKERLGDNGFVTNKWLPGLLTNTETLFGIEPLLNGAYLPDLVVFLNPAQTSQAVRECILRNIPTVGIVDSDTDPRFVTYPIPANSQSLRTAELVAGTLSLAGQEGQRLRLKEAEQRQRASPEKRRVEQDRRS